jgi:pyruvate kinase
MTKGSAMRRGTKIVATIGPASSSEAVLEKLLEAGVNTVRLNFSHGTAEEHVERAMLVRDIAERKGLCVAIMADLQGPKIRVGRFREQQVELTEGARFILDSACQLGDQQRVGLDYPALPGDVAPGDILLLDDGKIRLKVIEVAATEVHCQVLTSGVLSNHKGINRLGGGLSAAALTEKDVEDIRTAATLGADFVAVSFPKSATDMLLARTLLNNAGSHAALIAKIERTEAIDHLGEIIDASDGIMVARGDLAVEVGDAAVPGLQKQMIQLARERHKLVITATQMMESMIDCPVPTRAEVSDVANAVLDGTDAVMLSAETATGRFPLEAVEAMHRACVEAEKYAGVAGAVTPHREGLLQAVETVAMSVVYASRHLPLTAVVALTRSGKTAMMMSRYRLGVPIVAMTPTLNTFRRLAMCRQVFPVLAPECNTGTDAERIERVQRILLSQALARSDDNLCVTYGAGRCGDTDTMRIVHLT